MIYLSYITMLTKDRILQTAVAHFNQRGYHSMTLTDIAHSCEMSRGNLAYHYKNKDHILNDLVVRMVREVRELQNQRKDFPAFSNLSLDVRTCGILQERYRFIFRDTSVLEHNTVKRVMKIWSEVSIRRNREAFGFGVDIGNMKPELFDGLYSQLAVNAWMVAYYWVAQQSIRIVDHQEEAEKMIWSTVIPHFTTKGMNSFEQFYGPNYLKQMGKPIEEYIDLKQLF